MKPVGQVFSLRGTSSVPLFERRRAPKRTGKSSPARNPVPAGGESDAMVRLILALVPLAFAAAADDRDRDIQAVLNPTGVPGAAIPIAKDGRGRPVVVEGG
jgi:hypothetical protein